MTTSRRAALALAVAFAAAHGFYQAGRAFFHPKQGLDLAPSYLAGRMLRGGSTAFYDDAVVGALGSALGMHGPEGPLAPVLNFIYPPWVPAVYAPLSFLPWDAARRLWFVLSFLAGVVALLATVRAVVPDEGERKGAAILVLASVTFYFPFFYGLMTGQSNDLLLLLVAGALLLLVRGQPLAAGALLAPAILFKPFLAAVLPFLVFRREWRALAGFAVGAGALAALSLPIGGPAGWADWLGQIRLHNGLTELEPRNHGLASAVLSLGLPPGLAAALLVALEAAVLLALLALLLPATRRDEPRYALQFAASLVPALLLTPKAWEHYGVFLLPAFVAAAVVALREDESTARLAALGASFAAWGLLLQGRDEYRALSDAGLLRLSGVKAVAALALLLLAVLLVRRRPPQSAAAVARPSR